ncbi:minor tail protein [Escherichia coli]|nr:minor tail protein [Escherichia coli]
MMSCHINQRYLETASLLVAMSLWHTHSLKGTLASPETRDAAEPP